MKDWNRVRFVSIDSIVFTGKRLFSKENSVFLNFLIVLILEYAKKDWSGICFVNLVDFDMLFGHRRDIDGYAKALHEFDVWLPTFLHGLYPNDVLIITADHGCDPTLNVILIIRGRMCR